MLLLNIYEKVQFFNAKKYHLVSFCDMIDIASFEKSGEPGERETMNTQHTPSTKRDPADYGYPIPDLEALSAKAAEVSRRLTERYGELPFSDKDPLSQLVDILLSHRTKDAQTAAAYDNLLRV